jgi:hypothetical protein
MTGVASKAARDVKGRVKSVVCVFRQDEEGGGKFVPYVETQPDGHLQVRMARGGVRIFAEMRPLLNWLQEKLEYLGKVEVVRENDASLASYGISGHERS